MPVTAAGKYRDLVSLIIRSNAVTPNELGETIASQTNNPYQTVWAAVKPVKSAEKTENAETVLDALFEVKLRYTTLTSTLTHQDAILYRNRTLEIDSISNDEDGWESDREIILNCHEYRPNT